MSKFGYSAHSVTSLKLLSSPAFLLAAHLMLVVSNAWAAAITGIWYASTGGDFVGQGQTVEVGAPDWTLTPWLANENRLIVEALGPSGGRRDLTISAPLEKPLVPGAYENAIRSATLASPGLAFAVDGRGCNTSYSRFAILEYSTDAGQLRFAANFEQRCDGTGVLYGEIRLNSEIPYTYAKPPGTSQPDPFALLAQGPVQPAAVVTTNAFTVYGTNSPSAISVVNGEYRVNGGPFTNAAGTVQPRDTVVVRFLAATTPGTSSEVTLNVGGRSANARVTTYQEGMILTGLSYDGRPGDPIGNGRPERYLAPHASLRTERYFDYQAIFTLEGELGNQFGLWLEAPTSQALGEGAYFDPGLGSETTPSLHFYGNGDGCAQPSGRFTVYEAVYAGDGSISRFAADFEQRCDVASRPLFGEVRFNSTVPFYKLAAPWRPQAKVADFDGDGRDDLLWRHDDGGYGLWLMNGASASGYSRLFYGGSGLEIVQVGDFNRDGKTDLLGRYPDGAVRIWMMDGLGAWAAIGVQAAGTSWTPVKVGDFDGDGKADILWRHIDGSFGIWIMDGYAPRTYGVILAAGNGYDMVLVADLDGDGKSDLVGVHDDGHVRAWQMDGARGTMAATLAAADSGLVPVLAADFDGDGRADLAWRGQDGRYSLTRMAGVWIVGEAEIAGPNWNLRATTVADLNGDGRADILWFDPLGSTYASLMMGAPGATPAQLESGGSGWSLIAIADHDANGRADLVWRHTNGSHRVWLMNGLVPGSSAPLIGSGTGWNVLP